VVSIGVPSRLPTVLIGPLLAFHEFVLVTTKKVYYYSYSCDYGEGSS